MAAQRTTGLKRQIVRYVTGFATALGVTLLAFWLVMNEVVRGRGLIAIVMALAVVQLTVQLVFFLHVGEEERPRWNLMALLFMLIILVIIVAGSLWIMNNLNYNMMMTSEQMDAYMMEQREKGF